VNNKLACRRGSVEQQPSWSILFAKMQLPEPQVYWWREEYLSEENEAKVSELRQTLGALLVPGLDDRVDLLRFLKARHWNVAKAAKTYQVKRVAVMRPCRCSSRAISCWGKAGGTVLLTAPPT
jgi:hypothetical protein